MKGLDARYFVDIEVCSGPTLVLINDIPSAFNAYTRLSCDSSRRTSSKLAAMFATNCSPTQFLIPPLPPPTYPRRTTRGTRPSRPPCRSSYSRCNPINARLGVSTYCHWAARQSFLDRLNLPSADGVVRSAASPSSRYSVRWSARPGWLRTLEVRGKGGLGRG